MIMHATQTTPPTPVGRIKRFGEFGPAYEVGEPVRRLEDDDWLVQIVVVETGETADYRLSRLLNDPDAR